MNKTKNKNLLEYLSLSLVFYFLVFHKILLIIAGIIIALYCIEKEDQLNIFKIQISNRKVNYKVKIENKCKLYKQKEDAVIGSCDIKSLQAEEEFGFIPSSYVIDNNRAT